MNKRLQKLVTISIVLSTIIYIFILYFINYMSIWHYSSLSLILSLYPYLYILLIFMVVLSLFTMFQRDVPESILLAISGVIGYFLFFTPRYLAEFAYEADTISCTTQGLFINEILASPYNPLVKYPQTFPGSYLHTYIVIKVSNLGFIDYGGLIFPLIYIPLFVLLTFLAVKRIFNKDIAFYSIVFMLPALHFFHARPSPQCLGMLLILSCFLLMNINCKNLMFACVMIILFAMTISHPLSPILLLILVTGFFFSATLTNDATKTRYLNLVAYAIIIWLIWLIFNSYGSGESILSSLANLVTLDFGNGNIESIESHATGSVFIYQWIFDLSKIIYVIYIIFVGSYVLYLTYKIGIRGIILALFTNSKVNGLNLFEIRSMRLILPIGLFGMFIPISGLVAGQDIFERALTFLIIVSSVIIGYLFHLFKYRLARTNLSTIIWGLLVVFVFFIFLTFPIIAYSIAPYNTIPPSEGEGLYFLKNKVNLNDAHVYMSYPGDLWITGSLISRSIRITNPSWELSEWSDEFAPDFVILRTSGYFQAAMRLDKSFETNRYLDATRAMVKEQYNKIESSVTFVTWMKQLN